MWPHARFFVRGREAVKRSTLRRPPQQVGCIVLFSVATQNETIDTRYILPYQTRRVGHWFDDGEFSASKTYLDLPSFAEPPEYSIVVSADDDEYAGRTKVLQKFASNDDPSSDALDHDGRCRKLLEISGTHTAVELLELGPLTDAAMLRYQIEYADAFAFVFSLYSPKTLETAQRLRDKIEGAARNHHNIITMSDYERPGMRVPVFLIGNRDADLAPPQEMEEGDFSPAAFHDKADAEMRALREKAKDLAQEWKCAYFEVDTSASGEEHGVDEAVTGIGHFIRAAERPSTASTTSFSTPMKPPKQYRIRRFLGRVSRITNFSS